MIDSRVASNQLRACERRGLSIQGGRVLDRRGGGERVANWATGFCTRPRLCWCHSLLHTAMRSQTGGLSGVISHRYGVGQH